MKFGKSGEEYFRQSDLVTDLFLPAIKDAFPNIIEIKRADEIAEERGTVFTGLIHALATFG